MPDLVRRTVFLLASLVLGVALTAQQSPQAPATPAPQPPPAGTAPQGPPPGGAGPGGRQGGRGFRGGTPIQAGEECPQGMTEVRPRSLPGSQPSATEHRRLPADSTLVTAEHKVPKAKYPAIDFHGHPQGLFGSPEGLAGLSARWTPERAPDGERGQYVGRAASAHDRHDTRHAVQGSCQGACGD